MKRHFCILGLALLSLVAQAKEWEHPGGRPFWGERAAAIDKLDASAEDKKIIKDKVAIHNYDDIVAVGNGYVMGQHRAYSSEVTQMNFGDGSQIWPTVERKTWAPGREERGMVYRAPGLIVVIFEVCRNVAVLHEGTPLAMLPPESESAGGGGGGYAAPLSPLDLGTLEPIPTVPLMPAADPVLVADHPVGYVSGIPEGWGRPGAPLMPPDRWIHLPVVPIAPAVPEPATWMLFALGILGVALLRWTRR